MLTTSHDHAVIALAACGSITSWSPGAERLVGHACDEAVGRDFETLLLGRASPTGRPRLLEEARARGHVERVAPGIRKDGSDFSAEVVVTAMYDAEQTLTGYVAVVRDLTALDRLEAAQSSSYNAFEHDVRIPISAIKGFSELVRQTATADLAGFLDRIDLNADRVLAMLSDLPHPARRRTAPVLRRVDLAALARQTIENLGGAACSRTTVRTAEGHPAVVTVLAHAVSLERVIANVLNNALAYSPADSRVTCRVERDRAEGVLHVSDRGRGIDHRDLDLVLEEFERGRMSRDEPGSGVGLASARELMHLQSGSIHVASTRGVGTTVSLRLPLGAASGG